jgi:hypothetical protein
MTTKSRAPKSPTERIADYIESTIGDVDPSITLVDRDLVTGDIIVLFASGERLKISITTEDR